MDDKQNISCAKCGNILLPDTVFCEKCGTKVPEGVLDKNNTHYVVDSYGVKQNKGQKKRKIIWIVSSFVLLAVVVTVFVFVIRGLNSSRNEEGSLSYLETLHTDEHSLDNEVTDTNTPSVQGDSNNKPSKNENSSQGNADTPKITCLNGGCNNVVSTVGTYCAEHKCAKSGCGFEKDFSSSYCLTHKCMETGCSNASNDTGSYCVAHTCNESYCTSQKSINSDYCLLHKCNAVGCKIGRSGLGQYCVEHTCIDSGCTYQKSIGSEYCSSHECMNAGCHNARSGYSYYCTQHKCAKLGCNSQKSIMSEYCLLHDD